MFSHSSSVFICDLSCDVCPEAREGLKTVTVLVGESLNASVLIINNPSNAGIGARTVGQIGDDSAALLQSLS